MPAIVVTVAYATPNLQEIVEVGLSAGATAGEAIERSGLVAAYELDLSTLVIAIFGRRASLDTPLADGDRVELLRALVADPKEARRRRARAKPIARTPPRLRQRDG